MKIVTQALKEKKLTVEQLPAELQGKITDLKGKTDNYNAQCEAYEATPDVNKDEEARLDGLETEVVDLDNLLAGEIRAFTPAPEPTPPTPPAPTPTPTPTPTEPAKEEKNAGLGFILFGFAALAAALIGINLKRGK